MYTFKDGSTIQLKAIKYSSSMSEETLAFTAKLYLNGKALGTVENRGYGGSHEYSFDYVALDKRLRDEAPPKEGFFGETPYSLEYTLELFCNDEVNNYLAERDLKGFLRKKVLFKQTPTAKAIHGTIAYRSTGHAEQLKAYIKKKYPKSIILNDLPLADAVGIYREVI